MCFECSLTESSPTVSPTAMNRGDFLRMSGAGLAGAVLLGTGGVALAQTGGSLTGQLEAASEEYGVPVELLLAMGYVNALWEMPPAGATDFEEGNLHGRGDYGVMKLTQNPSRDTLGRAAELTGLSEETLKNDRAANIRGAAAVLSDIQGESSPELEEWQGAVSDYGDTELYAQEVFETLANGASLTISTGEEMSLAAQEGVEGPRVIELEGRGTDYPGAVWRPAYSGNYSRSNRERTYNINRLVVHVVQGSYSSAVNWFQDPRSQVSAHYVVSGGGRVAQCVRHNDIAHHAGNWSYNCHSIGIEHAGYGSNPRTWSNGMYRASAKLAAFICRKHRIPVSRRGIIGHRDVPGGTSSCPGPHFKFGKYIKLVKKYSGGRRKKRRRKGRRRRRR